MSATRLTRLERAVLAVYPRQVALDLKPSARQWFDHLSPILLASRPVTMVRHPHLLDADPRGRRKPKPLIVPVYGRPAFRNVIEGGELR